MSLKNEYVYLETLDTTWLVVRNELYYKTYLDNLAIESCCMHLHVVDAWKQFLNMFLTLRLKFKISADTC